MAPSLLGLLWVRCGTRGAIGDAVGDMVEERRTELGQDVWRMGQVKINTDSLSPLVFETELIGIEGVPKPESIVTKAATDAPPADPSAEAEAEAKAETPNVAEKVASKVAEAADVVKTIVADTDDSQEHNEL